MTQIEPEWERQPGGLYLALTPFDKFNHHHQDAAKSVLQSVIQKIAEVHDASYDKAGLRRNMIALKIGDITLDFYMAKWEVCSDQPICLGAAISWNTYGIDKNGQIKKAFYTEDVSTLMDGIRELIHKKPDGKDFPDEGIAEAFERLTIQNLRSRQGVHFKYGEVSPGNLKMRRALEKKGGVFGDEAESAVMELEQFPNNLMDRFPMNVEIDKTGLASTPNNFVTRLSDGIIDIRFVATKGQATAAGKPRVDLRPWHNGQLPNPEVLNCALASSLRTIHHEVLDRGWGSQIAAPLPSILIPLQAMRPEVYTALCKACGQTLTANPESRASTFLSPVPGAHVFVFNDKRMLDALTNLGARPRLFGNRPMMPGVNDLGSLSKLVV